MVFSYDDKNIFLNDVQFMIRGFLIVSFFLSFFCISAQNIYKSPLPCLDKKFTVVAHIVLDSVGETNVTQAQIQAAIDEANGYFSKICVSFEVCEYRYVQNHQYNVINHAKQSGELEVKNSLSSRINIYFIEEFKKLPACGIASLGGIAGYGSVYVLKSCLMPGDATMSHELGHFFGLEHTFAGNGTELADGSNCEVAGDKICDTPADPYVLGVTVDAYVQNCIYISGEKDSNGDFYDPDISNIMSYYPCACRFTDGQYRKMVEVYRASNPKTW